MSDSNSKNAETPESIRMDAVIRNLTDQRNNALDHVNTLVGEITLLSKLLFARDDTIKNLQTHLLNLQEKLDDALKQLETLESTNVDVQPKETLMD